MGKITDERLICEILAVVGEIPRGHVTTYGRIAALIGRDKNSRLVGRVLGMAYMFGDYPCHRVVNAAGRLVPGWARQRELLEGEGVTFTPSGHVNLQRHLWEA